LIIVSKPDNMFDLITTPRLLGIKEQVEYSVLVGISVVMISPSVLGWWTFFLPCSIKFPIVLTEKSAFQKNNDEGQLREES